MERRQPVTPAFDSADAVARARLAGMDQGAAPVCTESLIRVDDVMDVVPHVTACETYQRP